MVGAQGVHGEGRAGWGKQDSNRLINFATHTPIQTPIHMAGGGEDSGKMPSGRTAAAP